MKNLIYDEMFVRQLLEKVNTLGVMKFESDGKKDPLTFTTHGAMYLYVILALMKQFEQGFISIPLLFCNNTQMLSKSAFGKLTKSFCRRYGLHRVEVLKWKEKEERDDFLRKLFTMWHDLAGTECDETALKQALNFVEI